MKLKLLFICAVLCSVFATEDPRISFATRVANIVFRYHPELKIEREEFIRNYPANAELEDIHIGTAMYDRGLNLSTQEGFFLDALTHVARLVDVARHAGKGQKTIVADIGCGNGETSIIFSLVGAITLGVEKYMSEKEHTALGLRYAYAQKLAIKLGVDFNCVIKCSLDAKKLLVAEEDGKKFVHSNSYDVIFAGNFLHCISPAESKSLMETTFYNMLKPGGTIFASVDGPAQTIKDTAHANTPRDVYLMQKRIGAPFPTVIGSGFIGITERTRTGKELHFVNRSAIFLPCITNKKGEPATPIRGKDIRSLYYEDREIPGINICVTNSCLFDDALIGFLWPVSNWSLKVDKLNQLFRIDNCLPDDEVRKFYITATKTGSGVAAGEAGGAGGAGGPGTGVSVTAAAFDTGMAVAAAPESAATALASTTVAASAAAPEAAATAPAPAPAPATKKNKNKNKKKKK